MGAKLAVYSLFKLIVLPFAKQYFAKKDTHLFVAFEEDVIRNTVYTANRSLTDIELCGDCQKSHLGGETICFSKGLCRKIHKMMFLQFCVISSVAQKAILKGCFPFAKLLLPPFSHFILSSDEKSGKMKLLLRECIIAHFLL